MSELYDILKASNFSSSGGGDIDTSAYATALLMAINSDTYVLSSSLKNENGETLGTPQTIDLPLETMVVGGSYDDTTKKVILTLKNGNTVDFSVADLVEGLQSEITSSNKLDSDLVDDTNQNNKFVTSAEKTKIADALTEEVYNAGKTTPYGTQYEIAGKTYTVGRYAEIFNSYANNKAIGEYSHAEGDRTTATGNAAHAEGGALLASGTSSHAEGGGTVASGNYSHSEGSNTTASGDRSHAEGEFTNASGRNAHTQGQNTKAIGECSHAEGTYTIASSINQHVQGKFNIEDSDNKYAFIIGNGTYSQRSNAFAVDWNGNIYVNNSETGVNVSVHNSALIDLIDSGQKNLVDVQNPSGQQRVTITKGTNGSAVISCSNATWATTAYHVYITPNEDYKLILYVDNADVSNVTFRCFTSAVDDDGAELEVLPRTEQITGTGVYILDINTQYNRIKISPNINNSATAGSGSATIRMMLCSKAAWDISQKYVPYRPSYDELVARITALENA